MAAAHDNAIPPLSQWIMTAAWLTTGGLTTTDLTTKDLTTKDLTSHGDEGCSRFALGLCDNAVQLYTLRANKVCINVVCWIHIDICVSIR